MISSSDFSGLRLGLYYATFKHYLPNLVWACCVMYPEGTLKVIFQISLDIFAQVYLP